MPRYVYRCAGGHSTERVASIDARERPCEVCGLPAQRLPFYTDTAIQGETVAKPSRHRDKNPSLRHGYMDLDRAFEAMDGVQRDARKRGVEPPDLFAEARRRVESGEATESRIGR